jgi:RNA polymerase sigma-70 factor (ECF subfamily)
VPHDHEKTAELYRSFGPRVYRRCLRLLADEQDALDATQEVFLKLVANFPRLQDREQLLPWILNVARNHCLNVRRAAREVTVLTDELQPEAEGCADLTRALLARDLLERFDPGMQRVAFAVIGAGFDHGDAAAALGLSTAAVARKVQRFLAKARKYVRQGEYQEASGVLREATPERVPARRTLAAAPPLPPAPEPKPSPARAAPGRAIVRPPRPGEALESAA